MPPPETTVTPEAPPETTKPPGPQGIDPTRGNKFREALAKFKVEENKPQEPAPAPAESPEPSVPPTPAPAETTTPKEEPKKESEAPPTEKPSSALEAALGEEKPVEPPKDELAEFEKIEAPKGEDWKNARAVMKRQSEEIKALKSAPPKVDTNVEAITKERDELKERVEKLNTSLKAINAEYSEDYQKLQADREKAVTKVANRMKYSGASEKVEDLISALGMPEGRLKTTAVKEALAELDPDDKIAVRALIERVDEADEKIADFRKDLPSQWDKLQAQRDNDLREQSEKGLKQLQSEFHKVVEELPNRLPRLRLVPEDITGAKEWNEPIRKAISGALAALQPNGTDFTQTVEIAVKGGLFDHLWQDYVAKNKELQEANARLRGFDEGSPDFKGQRKPTTEPAKTPGQKYREALNARQGAAVAP